MKLFYSVNSPYARKCRVVAYEKDLKNRVEMQRVDPMENPPELVLANPLGKVPTLVTDGGMSLCDSTVICEYLDSTSDDSPLYPEGKALWSTLALAALADGMIDLSVDLILQKRRPKEQQWPDWMARREEAILRTASEVSGHMTGKEVPLTIAHINLACALAYIDFRHGHIPWRARNSKLAQWLDAFRDRPSMQATLPVA